MADVLLYQTGDEDFADRAVDALRGAGIDCLRAGSATGNLPYGKAIETISIFIRRARDYEEASRILITLGAVRDEPSAGRMSRTAWLLVGCAILAAAAIVLYWGPP